jgi:4-diphosphocytidyl-2-C-methyl-D-erythritol kinase
MPSTDLITEYARAKVNLTLEVLGRRPDGYHELASLVAFAEVADVITLVPDAPLSDTDLAGLSGGGPPGGENRVTVSGPFAGSLTSGLAGPNLIVTALQRLRAACPTLRLGTIHLEKRLPVAAGIGGGSADAAAVLRAVQRANPRLATQVPWDVIAASLGADVPVCLAQRTTWMTGTGGHLSPLSSVPTLHVVLVNAQAPVPADKTARVFRALAAPPLPSNWDRPPPPTFDPTAANSIDNADTTPTQHLISLMAKRGNSLEAATRQVIPTMSEVLTALGASGTGLVEPDSGPDREASPNEFHSGVGSQQEWEARDSAPRAPGAHQTVLTAALRPSALFAARPLFVAMSGAGPTCFAVYSTEALARRAGVLLQQRHPAWWVAATRLGG